MGDYTFSEHGEDILIHRLLLWKKNGFYLDCGAYHPRKMSLTARLRLFGWNGVNVDADARVIDVFNDQNNDAININAAVSSESGTVTLRRYEDPVINTISPEQIKHLDAIDATDGLFTEKLDDIRVESKTISQILKDNNVKNIDFMNLDIEGAELEAISGFPWEEMAPAVISCELHRLSLYNPCESQVVSKLTDLGYILQSYVFHTAIFIRGDFDVEQCHRVPFETL